MEDRPIKRFLAPIVVIFSLVLVPAAYACYVHPTKAGVSTSSRSIKGDCYAHAQYQGSSRLYVHCHHSSSADLRYTFTVPRSVHGIVGLVYYQWRDSGVTKRVTRSGTHVTVTVHVPAYARATIISASLQYYKHVS